MPVSPEQMEQALLSHASTDKTLLDLLIPRLTAGGAPLTNHWALNGSIATLTPLITGLVSTYE